MEEIIRNPTDRMRLRSLKQKFGNQCLSLLTSLVNTIEYAIKDKNISKYDDVVICNDHDQIIRIYIDPKASMFLIGSEMIFKKEALSAGFDFINPNEKGRCGCGESFNV